jgi:uncharacterized protein YkwD
MKKFFTYKYALLAILLLSTGIFIYGPELGNLFGIKYNPDNRTVTGDEQIPDDQGKKDIQNSDKTTNNSVTLEVRGTTVSIGDDADTIQKKLGTPSRIDDTEYDFQYYIYNNDYKKLVFVAVKNNKVAGFYTDSLDFSFLGISSGSSLNEVNHALGNTYSMNEVIIQKESAYTVRVLMDTLDTKKVSGIYVLTKGIKKGKFTDTVVRNIELMMYDLTNSIRARNDVPVLSWSSSAALAARGHSNDMAVNKYFNHLDLLGGTPRDRIGAEGIYFNSSAENIIAGYGTSILSNHALFNSRESRKSILNPKLRYLGVGFVYQSKSPHKTYFTADFYR